MSQHGCIKEYDIYQKEEVRMKQSNSWKSQYINLLVALCLATFTTPALSAEIDISGFATIAGGIADETNTAYQAYDEDADFKTDSLLAVQLDSDLGNGLSATAQIISKGVSNWETAFEWAYVSYDATDNWRLLLGRQRTPQNFFSDFVDVSYSYHWLTPPANMYRYSFDSYDGLGSMYNFSAGETDNTLHILVGRSDDNPLPEVISELDNKNYGIIAWTTNWRNLSFRATVNRSELTLSLPSLDDTIVSIWDSLSDTPLAATGIDFGAIADGVAAVDDDIDGYSVGAKIDFANSFVVAEWADSDASNSFLGQTERWYISGGIIRNDLTFHLTYGVEEVDVDMGFLGAASSIPALAPLIVGTQQALDGSTKDEDFVIAGIRWDFHSSAAAYVEYTSFQDDYVSALDPSDMDEDKGIFRVGISVLF